MSTHFSKFLLNTYSWTPYFEAHIPADYPLSIVLQKSRAFRRLPARLKELSTLSKEWAQQHYKGPDLNEINQWYNDDGDELNPTTGEIVTDAEIDREWESVEVDEDLVPEDIPLPDGGFADPKKWKEPAPTPDDDQDQITAEQLLEDIGSHGRQYVAKEYGVDMDEGGNDKALVRAIMEKLGH